jgi:predicted RNA-binding protein with PIN domain
VAPELLRPALELAWAVARVGEDASPPIQAPGAVRRLLRFSRLPDRALATLRRVLEQDEDFRKRVADAADETMLGRAAWLWLVRADGWDEELAALAAEAHQSASSAREEQEERSARRRLAAAEEARRRADVAAASATAAATRASEELTNERQARRNAETKVEGLAAALAAFETKVAQLLARAESAEQTSHRLRAAEITLVDERDRLLERIASLEFDLAEGERRLAALSEADGLTRDAVAGAVGDAARAAQQLGAALAAASRALGGDPDERVEQPEAPAAPAELTAPTSSRVARNDRVVRPPRRVAVPLPPAVFDDSAEAAEYLVRVPQMMLLVDGYNVSLQAWPDVAIPEQRRRLVDSLSGLAARTGISVHIVFDGAEQPEPRPTSLPPRSPVRLRFSPPDVEADEVLIEMAEELPSGRPVTVATSDRRVQDEVRRRGANVISTPQLLGLLGRAPSDTRGHTPSS